MHFFLSNVDFESIYCRDSGGLNDCFELITKLHILKILDKFCFVNHISLLINLVIFLCTRDVDVKISDFNLPS